MITRIRIGGMSCAHCVRAVFTALGGVEGVRRAEVSIGAAELEHDAPLDPGKVKEAVAVAGYEVLDGATNRRALPLA